MCLTVHSSITEDLRKTVFCSGFCERATSTMSQTGLAVIPVQSSIIIIIQATELQGAERERKKTAETDESVVCWTITGERKMKMSWTAAEKNKDKVCRVCDGCSQSGVSVHRQPPLL